MLALLETGRDLLLSGRDLLEASGSGNAVSAQELLSTQGRDGETALMRASAAGSVGAVTELLGVGANPNAADVRGRTPLMHASQGCKLGAIIKLLAAGADPNAADLRGWTALMYASKWRRMATQVIVDSMGKLIDAGADVNAVDLNGQTALRQNELDPEMFIADALRTGVWDRHDWITRIRVIRYQSFRGG